MPLCLIFSDILHLFIQYEFVCAVIFLILIVFYFFIFQGTTFSGTFTNKQVSIPILFLKTVEI